MNEVLIDKKNEIVIKLLHYFVTEKGYSPVILQGANNEIWLQNLDNDYKIIRIVSNYIHNDEQFEFDMFKTKHIVKKIKRKTFSFKMPVLSIFIDLGDSVNLDELSGFNGIDCAHIKNENDIDKYKFITAEFPDIDKKIDFKEKGIELFVKITSDINKKNEKENIAAEKVFKPKKPFVTYGLILINTIMFIILFIKSNGRFDAETLVDYGASFAPYIKNGEYYRLITSAFLHVGILHFLFNMYALYIIGSQLESFLGKIKFTIVYLFSAVTATLLSAAFSDYVSAGASGAIFGLIGALLYFGYHYRIYLGSVIRSQIIPLILVNLIIGFTVSGIDNAAHIGGLIGGFLILIGLGVNGKSTRFEKTNGFIMSAIYLGFLIFLVFFAK